MNFSFTLSSLEFVPQVLSGFVSLAAPAFFWSTVLKVRPCSVNLSPRLFPACSPDESGLRFFWQECFHFLKPVGSLVPNGFVASNARLLEWQPTTIFHHHHDHHHGKPRKSTTIHGWDNFSSGTRHGAYQIRILLPPRSECMVGNLQHVVACFLPPTIITSHFCTCIHQPCPKFVSVLLARGVFQIKPIFDNTNLLQLCLAVRLLPFFFLVALVTATA